MNGLKDRDIKSCALTDHGNMSMVFKFANECLKNKIRPIVGQEFYVCDYVNIKNKKISKPFYHLIVLAKNEIGYKNLCNLSSLAYKKENAFYKPRVDLELLRQYKNGLIFLTACLGGIIGHKILNDEYKEAEKYILKLKIYFYNQVYLEMQCNRMSEQVKLNDFLVRMSLKHGVPLVMTPDTHYLNREDSYLQTLLWTIKRRSSNRNLTFKDVEKNNTCDEFYLKTYEEVLLSGIDTVSPEFKHVISYAIENSNKISESIDFTLIAKKNLFPVFSDFSVDIHENSFKYLSFLCYKWLNSNSFKNKKIYEERLKYELSVIKKRNFEDYFLIVYDFINWAKKDDILIGPGRGSAAGSLVVYSLGITNIDPILHNLKFERFLDLTRQEFPDIDIDIDDEDRKRCMLYLESRWGKEKVAHIGTLTMFSIRSSLADTLKSYGKESVWNEIDRNLPKGEVKLRDSNDNLVPKEKVNISMLIKQYPFISLFRDDNIIEFNASNSIIGCCKNVSSHASGILISRYPICDYVPTLEKRNKKSTDDNLPIAQFDMNDCESIGLIKFDYLSLRTLRTIKLVRRYIKLNHNIDIVLTEDDLNKKEIFSLIRKGFNKGIFQLDSEIGISVARQVGVDSITTMGISVALGRPGPINNGYVDNYEKKRLGEVSVTYLIPEFEKILSETQGEITYQEQIMEISVVYAGFTEIESNTFRKAMGKKKPELMAEQKSIFISGAVKKGHSEKQAIKLFDELAKFAEYGFNASHAKSYAKIACEMLWYKYHYPIEFFCALLTAEAKKDREKLILYINECKVMGIEVLPCNVNKSGYECTREENSMRLGFIIIKDMDKKTANEIKDKSPYTSLDDFYQRISIKNINQGSINAIVLSGGFDSVCPNRRNYIYKYQGIFNKERKLLDHKIKKELNKNNYFLDFGYTDQNKSIFNSEFILKKWIEKLTDKHNKNLESYNDGISEKLANSPLLLIKGVNFDNYERQEFSDWMNNIHDVFSETEKYLSERQIMSFSFSKNPFKKHDLYYKKNTELRRIKDITEDLDVDDWSKVYFLGLILKKEHIIDRNNQNKKIKLLVSDQSHEVNMTITSKKFENMDELIEEGHIYHFQGKVCPQGRNNTRYITVDKIIKQLDD